ncbi:MAG: DUF5989 family protein [Planctomycetales bacterium]
MSQSIESADPPPPDSPRDRPGLFAELFRLLMENKVWWLVPLIVGLIAVVWLLVSGGPGRPEYIYPLF